MTAKQIQKAISVWIFQPRQTLLVPNVSWGMGLPWEADLLAVTKARYTTEIEIKVSVSDFKKDFEKHKHKILDRYCINQFVYAMPKDIWDKAGVALPDNWGLILCREYNDIGDISARWEIRPKKVHKKKISDKCINDLMRLGYLRYWKQFIND